MAKCTPTNLHKAGFYAAVFGAVMLILGAVLVLIANIATLLIFTPIGWMKAVCALWNIVFGLVILCVQFGKFTSTLDKYAGFVSTKFGRGLFYLYCGNVGGASMAEKDAAWYLVLISIIIFGALWYVGFLELCGPRKPASMMVNAKDIPSEHVPTLSPLGGASVSSSEAGNPGAPGSIAITVTPDQALGAAKFASKNQAVASAAWSAAVAADTSKGAASGSAAGAEADTAGTKPLQAPNPFFSN